MKCYYINPLLCDKACYRQKTKSFPCVDFTFQLWGQLMSLVKTKMVIGLLIMASPESKVQRIWKIWMILDTKEQNTFLKTCHWVFVLASGDSSQLNDVKCRSQSS